MSVNASKSNDCEIIESCDRDSGNLLSKLKSFCHSLRVQVAEVENCEPNKKMSNEEVDEYDLEMSGDLFLYNNKTSKHSSTPKHTLQREQDAKYHLPNEIVSKKTPSKNIEDDIWTTYSEPFVCAKSHETSDCDFRLVETVLPKVQENPSRRIVEHSDGASDGSHSHTVFTVAKLVSSINKHKKEIKVLEERVKSLENELTASKMTLDLEKTKSDKYDCGKVLLLVEEIYQAQREREAAVLARMKLANQERDEALLKSNACFKEGRLLSEKEEPKHLLSDASLQELLAGIFHATSARALAKHGASILDRIAKIKQDRDNIVQEEMHAVMNERDVAINKHQNVTEETMTSSPNRSLLAIRSSGEDESHRNPTAPVHFSDTRKELEMLQINYSLSKSLQKKVFRGGCETGNCCDDAERLAELLRVAEEHSRLQEAVKRRNDEEMKKMVEKNEKLERLVAVLRKKLIAQTRRQVTS